MLSWDNQGYPPPVRDLSARRNCYDFALGFVNVSTLSTYSESVEDMIL